MLRLKQFPLLLVSVGLLLATGCKKDAKDAPKDKAEESAKVTDEKAAPAGDTPVAPKGEAATGALAYLPGDCDIAIHIDFASVMSVPAVRDALLPALEKAKAAGAKDKESFGNFLKQSGMDPIKDLHQLAVCVDDIKMDGSDPKAFGAVSGNLKPDLMDILIKTSEKLEKREQIKEGGFHIVRDDEAIIAQADDGVVMGGNSPALFDLFKKKSSGFQADFQAMGPASLRVIVATKLAKTGLAQPGSPFAAFAEKLAGNTTFSFDATSGEAVLRVATADEASASELAGVAKMLLSQVPKAGGAGPEAMAMSAISAAKIGAEGSVFSMSVAVPVADIAKMAAAGIEGGL